MQAGISHLWLAHPCAAQWSALSLGGAILPECRPTECWGTSSLCDGSRTVHLDQPPIQGQTSEASVYTNLHLYNVGGRHAVLWGLGSCCSCSWGWGNIALEPSCGWCVPAVLSPVLSGHQVWVRGNSEARVSQDIPEPASESPVRNKADRLPLKK